MNRKRYGLHRGPEQSNVAAIPRQHHAARNYRYGRWRKGSAVLEASFQTCPECRKESGNRAVTTPLEFDHNSDRTLSANHLASKSEMVFQVQYMLFVLTIRGREERRFHDN